MAVGLHFHVTPRPSLKRSGEITCLSLAFASYWCSAGYSMNAESKYFMEHRRPQEWLVDNFMNGELNHMGVCEVKPCHMHFFHLLICSLVRIPGHLCVFQAKRESRGSGPLRICVDEPIFHEEVGIALVRQRRSYPPGWVGRSRGKCRHRLNYALWGYQWHPLRTSPEVPSPFSRRTAKGLCAHQVQEDSSCAAFIISNWGWKHS